MARKRKRAAGHPSTTRIFHSERFRPGRLRPPPSPLTPHRRPSFRVARQKEMRKRATMVAMNLAVRKPMSLAEFLEWEDRQELRYEFDGVEPSAMTGGTVAHATIQGNLAVAIGGRLRGRPCRFYGSDLKIRVADDHIRYPDGMVVCSRVDQTAKDRIVKAREYQATPSVKRYVMLEQERIGATVLVRAQDGWSALILKDDDALDMPEIGLAIPLAEFYEGLAFGAQPVEDSDRPPPATA